MKKTTLAAALVAVLSQTPVYAGDAGAGAGAYAAKGCIGCHGASGKAPIAANYPVIGGKEAAFLVGELNKFKSGERKEPTMNAMASTLSDSDIANISAWLATQ